jgi:hypothetical protein
MALDPAIPTVASAAALAIPDSPIRRATDQTIMLGVTGTADITSISAMRAGTRLVLIFTGTAAVNGVVDGGNLKLVAAFAYTPDDALELISDGVNWYELGRNAN